MAWPRPCDVLPQQMYRQSRYIPEQDRPTNPSRRSLCHAEGVSIIGAHVVVYSANPVADRDFFRDVLQYPHVDAGGGWLIFALPPAEVAVHPGGPPHAHELYLMCDDLDSTADSLRAHGVEFDEVEQARWGRVTRFRLPGGSRIGLYQPLHPLAVAR